MEAMFDWNAFLKEWESEIRMVMSLIPSNVLDQDDIAAAYGAPMSAPPAPEHELLAKERELGIRLPDDLRSFYLATNGWQQYGFDEYTLQIRSVEHLCWLSASATRVSDIGDYFEADEVARLLDISEPCSSGAYTVALSHSGGGGDATVIRFHAAPRGYASFYKMMIAERIRCINSFRELLD